jgi:hypothetical protein
MMEDRQAELSRKYLDEYLATRGHTWESVQALPPEQARNILIAASTYASDKMAEVQTRAHMIEELHGAQPI